MFTKAMEAGSLGDLTRKPPKTKRMVCRNCGREFWRLGTSRRTRCYDLECELDWERKQVRKYARKRRRT